MIYKAFNGVQSVSQVVQLRHGEGKSGARGAAWREDVHPRRTRYSHDGWDAGRGDGLRWAGLQRGCSYSIPSRYGYWLFAPSLGIGDGPFLRLLIPGLLPPSSAPQDLVIPTKPCPDSLQHRF